MPVHSLSRGVQEVTKLVFSQSEVDYLKAKLFELTRATVVVRSPERDADGRTIYKEVPDSGIQLAAATKLMEFAQGKPRQSLALETSPERSEKAVTGRDLVLFLGKRPDLVDTIVATMTEVAKNAQAIKVEEVKPDSAPQPPESESEGSPS